MDPVPLLDLKAQFAPLRDPIQRAVGEIIESQGFVLGPVVKALEDEVANATPARVTPWAARRAPTP